MIDKDGTDPVDGLFDGLPEDATLLIGAEEFRISYVGGTLNASRLGPWIRHPEALRGSWAPLILSFTETSLLGD